MTRICGLCHGPLVLLGVLGRLYWFRCQNCGVQYSSPSRPARSRPARQDEGKDRKGRLP